MVGKLALAPGFDGTEITVGLIAPLTGPSAPLAKGVVAGTQRYWDELNAKGGIAGRYKVRVRKGDGEFFESVAVIRYDEIEKDIALVQTFDTKATKAMLPRLQMHKVVGFPVTDDPGWIREQNLVPLGAPAEIRAINAISYWADHGGRGKRLCALHQDDTYGPVGFDGVTFAADELHLTLAAQPTFKPLEPALDRQVDQVAQAKCDAVFFNGYGYQALAAVRHAQAIGFTPRWIGSAASWEASTASATDAAGYLHAHYWVVGNGPAWGDRSLPGMKQLMAARQRFAPGEKPDASLEIGYLQSWAASQVLEDAVRHADLSRSGLLEATRRVGTLRFDGLYPDYPLGSSADTRHAPRTSTVFEVDPSTSGGLGVVQGETESAAAKRFGRAG